MLGWDYQPSHIEFEYLHLAQLQFHPAQFHANDRGKVMQISSLIFMCRGKFPRERFVNQEQ